MNTTKTPKATVKGPMRPKRPILPDGTVQNVPLGTVRGFLAGAYVNQDVTATVQIEGDSNGVFRILRVETDDVVFIDDPDVRKRVEVLETALKVEGPGPIEIFADQAIIVAVEFSCPSDPAQVKFNATLTAAGIAIPIVATANLGFVYGNVLSGPSDLAPGEFGQVAIELFSSMGHAVEVAVAYDSEFDSNFSAPTSQLITVPPAGGTVHLTMQISCALGTPEGVHHLGFMLVAQDGTPFARGMVFGTQVTVIGGTVVTRVDTTSPVMVKGGITPINLNIRSVRGGATDVSYRLSGPPEFGLSGSPIHVDAGKTVRGTVWLEASLDAPQDVTLQLTQFSFSAQGDLIPTEIFASALPPPAGEDFVMFRVYWGPKWTIGNPFSWQQLEKAIFTIIRSAYLKGLREYGVASVSDVAVSNAPGEPPTTLPTVAFDPNFPSSNDFDEPDVIKVITGLLEAGQLPRPDQIRGTPFYCVIPQQGSFYRPDPNQNFNGMHSTFAYRGTNSLYGWAFQGGDVDGTSPFVIHELVEAVSAKGAGLEVGDPCQSLTGGRSAGVAVQPYLSKQNNLCVLPDMANNPDIAARSPPPPKN